MATLKMLPCVCYDGVEPRWFIKESEKITLGDGRCFVALAAKNSSLARVVNALADSDCKHKSVAAYAGYSELKQLRTEACLALQAETLAASQGKRKHRCTLFDGDEDSNSPRCSRLVRGTTARKRACEDADAVVVRVQMGANELEIELLKAEHPSDMIYVSYEQRSVEAVLQFMATRGLMGVKSPRNKDIPKGVHKHSLGFIVRYKNTSGQDRSKLKRNLEEALAFHAHPIDEDDEEASTHEAEVNA